MVTGSLTSKSAEIAQELKSTSLNVDNQNYNTSQRQTAQQNAEIASIKRRC